MKHIPGIGILLFSYIPLLLADESTFSDWMEPTEFEAFYTTKTSNEYPPIIEAKPLLGDGVAYRALFIQKPSNDFEYQSEYGISDKLFKEINTKLKEKEFVLIHHQEVMLMGGTSNQATWVKNETGL